MRQVGLCLRVLPPSVEGPIGRLGGLILGETGVTLGYLPI